MQAKCIVSGCVLAFAVILSGCADPGVIYETPHVYVAGVLAAASGLSQATYWRDGVPVTLDTRDDYSTASDIAVSGSDIYVAGSTGTGSGNNIVKLWKNGVPTSISDGTQMGWASGVALSGSDVYVSGTQSNGRFYTATYWKNGASVSLPSGSADGAGAGPIAISGSDVYIVGYTDVQSSAYSVPTPIATLWKNGVATLLTDTAHFSEANGLFVSGSDVYVAGFAVQTSGGYDHQAVYWKNGVQVTLPAPAGSGFTEANDITLAGQDIYVSGGNDVDVAGYWRNGVFVQSVGSLMSTLAVSGTDVYIAGTNYARVSNTGVLDPGTAAWTGATVYLNGKATPLAPNATSSGAGGMVLAYN